MKIGGWDLFRVESEKYHVQEGSQHYLSARIAFEEFLTVEIHIIALSFTDDFLITYSFKN